jgi:hypothetical protein
MPDEYFGRFPKIVYNGFSTRNLTERVKLVNTPASTPVNFHPYTIIENMRPDQIAGQYYNNSGMDWLIYLTNNITDPYYGWHLSESEFDDFIISRYGSIDNAQQQIVAYRTNWPVDDKNLSISYYNSLPGAIKKYYQPIWGPSKIMGYTRRQEDWVVSTNRILDLSLTMNSNTNISNGELVTITLAGNTQGFAECVMANDSVITIKNVEGNTAIGMNVNLRSNTAVNGSITASSVKIENIPLSEEVYWSPAYAYDIEAENNASHQFIDLLEKNYAMPISEDIRKKLNG